MPLVLAVVGERALPPGSADRVEAVLRSVLERVAALWGDAPRVLLCSLLDDVGRTAARLAREGAGRFELYLALPSDEARHDDFLAAAGCTSEGRLRECVSDAAAKIDLSSFFEDGAPAGADEAPRLCGAFLAKNCNILLALRDPRSPDASGSAAETVRFMLEGVPANDGPASIFAPHSALGDSPDVGPVYEIDWAQALDPACPPGRVKIHRHFPTEYGSSVDAGGCGPAVEFPEASSPDEIARAQAKDHETVLRLTAAFNRDLGDPRISPFRDPRSLLDPATVPGLGGSAAFVRERYDVADAVAQRCRRGIGACEAGMFVAAFTALAVFEIVTNFASPEAHWALLLYPAALGLGGCLWLVAFTRRLQQRWLDARTLAEGLRVQFFWDLVGIDRSVADHYLRYQRTEMLWVAEAIRAYNLVRLMNRGRWRAATLGWEEALALAERHWLSDQLCWFLRRSRELNRVLRSVRPTAGALVLLSLAVALWQATFPLLDPVTTGIALALGLAAVLHGWLEHRATTANVRRYQWVAVLVAKALRQLGELKERRAAAPAPPQQVQADKAILALLRAFGREALIENGNWLMLHRERPTDLQVS